jgi:hypothetical protein
MFFYLSKEIMFNRTKILGTFLVFVVARLSRFFPLNGNCFCGIDKTEKEEEEVIKVIKHKSELTKAETQLTITNPRMKD